MENNKDKKIMVTYKEKIDYFDMGWGVASGVIAYLTVLWLTGISVIFLIDLIKHAI